MVERTSQSGDSTELIGAATTVSPTSGPTRRPTAGFSAGPGVRLSSWARSALVLGSSIALGALLAVQPTVGVLVAGGVAVVIALVADTVTLPMVGVPAVFLAWRVGGQGRSGVSLADLALLAGTLAAISLLDWTSPLLRRLLGLIVVYQGLLLLSVVANPSPAAAIEWGHRFLLLAGSVLVGAVLAQRGRIESALRLYLLLAGCVAVAAIVGSVLTGFGPAFPLGLSKNFAGSLLAMAILVAVAAPGFTGVRRRLLPWCEALLLCGMLATQSRGAAASLAAGLIAWALVSQGGSWRVPLAFILSVVMVAFVVSSLASDPTTNATYGSVGSRRAFRVEAMSLWREAPVFGKGIRFYDQVNSQLRSNPHNVVVEALAESGALGAGALFVLLALSLLWLRRLRQPIAIAALVLIVAKFAHGLVDIYWLAGSDSLPWILAGMAVVAAGSGPPAAVSTAAPATADA